MTFQKCFIKFDHKNTYTRLFFFVVATLKFSQEIMVLKRYRKWYDYGFISNTEAIEVPDRLAVGFWEIEESRMTSSIWSKQMEGSSHYSVRGEAWKCNNFKEEMLSFRNVNSEMPITHECRVSSLCSLRFFLYFSLFCSLAQETDLCSFHQ